MLWTGLSTSLHSRTSQDTNKEFDSLRVALRQIENDQMHREVLIQCSNPQTSKAEIEPSDVEDIKIKLSDVENIKIEPFDVEDIKGMDQQMATRIDNYEKKLDQQEPPWHQQAPLMATINLATKALTTKPATRMASTER